MFLKRVAAVLATLLLLLQVTACKQELPSVSTNDALLSVSSQTTGTDVHIAESATKNSSVNNTYTPSENSTSSSGQSGTNHSQQTMVTGKTPSDNATQSTAQSNTSVVCDHSDGDPYQNVNKTAFYATYTVACCNTDAAYRSKHGLLSGSLHIPDQYAQESQSRPMTGGKYIRNTAAVYVDDGNTYVVLDASGKETMRIHKAGGYITLEEVAAYMYAFGGGGQIPANYVSKKSTKPSSSIWGEYLRVNHSYFLGDTDRYPYEPALPDISGCGGDLRYYEMDIGTTGTATPGYAAKPYVQGNKINRGAARIVYARQDLNGNGKYENNEVYVFYTHNHYNDFREYLNYYGGWGEMFGNVTGGGEYSSETNANPTPYVQTAYKNFATE